jgi:uncharacterized protein YcnI
MTMRTLLRAAVLAALAALFVAPAASAHVTLNPREWEAGGFARFSVRVPNERPDASTTEVTVQFPDNVISASFQPIPGWTRTVKMATLDEPIEGEDGPITEKIESVTWTGGEIKPGEFQEFGVSFQVPEDAAGSSLVFPAVQTYSSGEVVRWIGDESADEPAPTVAVLAAATEEEEEPATDTTATETTAPDEGTAGEAASATDDDGEDDGQATLALVLSIIALAAGLGALGFALFRPGRAKS